MVLHDSNVFSNPKEYQPERWKAQSIYDGPGLCGIWLRTLVSISNIFIDILRMEHLPSTPRAPVDEQGNIIKLKPEFTHGSLLKKNRINATTEYT